MPASYASPGVYVEEVPPLARPIAGVGTSTPAFIGVVDDTLHLPADDGKGVLKWVTVELQAEALKPYFISSWGQYARLFGGLVGDKDDTTSTSSSLAEGQRHLAHAVYGFLNNGGAGCYVVRIEATTDLQKALDKLAAIDEITMVAAPGFTTAAAYEALLTHCENSKDRVAILDSVERTDELDAGTYTALSGTLGPRDSSFGAFYFPWIGVDDPACKLIEGKNYRGSIYVPPSGHMAGIYARSDAERGVFKAPANEVVRGAVSLKYQLSRADHDQLNAAGVNVIRPLIGAIRVWGARTVGGDANGEYRYISTRRYFNYLRESIQNGTQFVVFEPNSPVLWERIKRSVGGFLTNEWRSGALFGSKVEQAFYVKCDADTNPADVREAGQVVTEIGIAIVKPAEFVVFRIQQNSGS